VVVEQKQSPYCFLEDKYLPFRVMYLSHHCGQFSLTSRLSLALKLLYLFLRDSEEVPDCSEVVRDLFNCPGTTTLHR